MFGEAGDLDAGSVVLTEAEVGEDNGINAAAVALAGIYKKALIGDSEQPAPSSAATTRAPPSEAMQETPVQTPFPSPSQSPSPAPLDIPELPAGCDQLGTTQESALKLEKIMRQEGDRRDALLIKTEPPDSDQEEANMRKAVETAISTGQWQSRTALGSR